MPRKENKGISYGDYLAERRGLTRAQRIKAELENAATKKELISTKEVATVINRAIVAIKGRILACANMESEDKEQILKEIERLWCESFGSAGTDPEDVATTAQDDGERVGDPVPVS